MCTFNNGPRILGKIELPEVYHCKPGYESVVCICCGESSGTLYKQGGQWVHDACIEAEEAQYWDEMAEQQQRHQDRLNALRADY